MLSSSSDFSFLPPLASSSRPRLKRRATSSQGNSILIQPFLLRASQRRKLPSLGSTFTPPGELDLLLPPLQPTSLTPLLFFPWSQTTLLTPPTTKAVPSPDRKCKGTTQLTFISHVRSLSFTLTSFAPPSSFCSSPSSVAFASPHPTLPALPRSSSSI